MKQENTSNFFSEGPESDTEGFLKGEGKDINEVVLGLLNKTKEISKEVEGQAKIISRNDQLIFFGFIFLLVMVAAMVMDSVSSHKPQINYNISLPADQIPEVIKK